MEPAATLMLEGREFALHATEKRGQATYAIRRFEKGASVEFLATKIEDREGRPVETPLAQIGGARQPYHTDEFYVEEIKNSANTPEGARMLSKLYDHMEEHLKRNGINSFTTDAIMHVHEFFRRKGYSTDNPSAPARLARFREKFAHLKKLRAETVDARRSALLSVVGSTIFMRKETPPHK